MATNGSCLCNVISKILQETFLVIQMFCEQCNAQQNGIGKKREPILHLWSQRINVKGK